MLYKQGYKSPLSRADKVLRTAANYQVTAGNIAAIEFGPTSVSLAYTTKGDYQINILILDPQEKASRVTNAVLLKREGKAISVVAFGNDAMHTFQAMRRAEKYLYFKTVLKRENVCLNLQLKMHALDLQCF